MMRFFLTRVAPAAVTTIVVLMLMFGMFWTASAQVLVNGLGNNPTAVVFPGPWWLVFGIGTTTNGASAFNVAPPTGACGTGAATTTGHNMMAIVTGVQSGVTTNTSTFEVTGFNGSSVSLTNVGAAAATPTYILICN